MCNKDGCPMDGTLANDFQCIVDKAKEAWLNSEPSAALVVWSEREKGVVFQLDEALKLPKRQYRRAIRGLLQEEYHGTADWYVIVSESWSVSVENLSAEDKRAILEGNKLVADCPEKENNLTIAGKARDGSFRLEVYNIIESGAGIDLQRIDKNCSDGSTGQSSSPLLDDVLLGLECPMLDDVDFGLIG